MTNLNDLLNEHESIRLDICKEIKRRVMIYAKHAFPDVTFNAVYLCRDSFDNMHPHTYINFNMKELDTLLNATHKRSEGVHFDVIQESDEHIAKVGDEHYESRARVEAKIKRDDMLKVSNKELKTLDWLLDKYGLPEHYKNG